MHPNWDVIWRNTEILVAIVAVLFVVTLFVIVHSRTVMRWDNAEDFLTCPGCNGYGQVKFDNYREKNEKIPPHLWNDPGMALMPCLVCHGSKQLNRELYEQWLNPKPPHRHGPGA